MNSKHLVSTNLIIVILYIITSYFGGSFAFLYIFKAILGFLFIFATGLNLAILLRILLKKDFDLVELLNLAVLGFLIFIPFVLFLETTYLKNTSQFQAEITLFSILLLTSIVLFLENKGGRKLFVEFPVIKFQRILSSPLTWVMFLWLIVILIIVCSYIFLPDKDPFKWYLRLTNYFENNRYDSNFSYRPLFYLTPFLFGSLTGLNTFTFLKYVIPFLFMLVFLPIWMVARKFNDSVKQLMVLLVPFLVPNAILYSLMGMPQSFFMILLYYFVFFLFYSYWSRDKFYYYAAGVIALGGALSHEAGIAIVALWTVVALFHAWNKIISNKKDILLVLIILFSNATAIRDYYTFIKAWASEVIAKILHPNLNLSYPIKYTTVDGIEAGSQNFIGVVKSYSGFVGPIMIVSLLAVLFFLIQKRIDPGKYWRLFKRSREFKIIFLGFLFFFSIAEILPRFPGIAMLPDRAWIYGSIFFSFFIPFAIVRSQTKRISKIIFFLYVFGIFLSIGGAVYGGYLKKFLINDEQLQSAEWIKQKLPEERVVISSGHNQLLQYFGQSRVVEVNEGFFYDEKALNAELEKYKKELLSGDDIEDRLCFEAETYGKNIAINNDKLVRIYSSSEYNIEVKSKVFKELAQANISLSQDFLRDLKYVSVCEELPPQTELFIYYAVPSEKSVSNKPILDNYPEKFERIYEADTSEEIVIWKVL